MNAPVTSEIMVMSSGSAEPALDVIAAAFKKETGHAVNITYNLGRRAIERLQRGDFDVVLASDESINRNYRPAGLVDDDGVSVGRMGIGVMVRPGAPLPDISSVQTLTRALIDAESILITTHTSGLSTEAMLRKLGVYDEANAKITRLPDGPSLLDRLLAGTGNEFAILSINHLGGYKDRVIVVGPLPDQVQLYREFLAVPASNSANKQVAREFVRYCGGPGKSVFVAHGFQ